MGAVPFHFSVMRGLDPAAVRLSELGCNCEVVILSNRHGPI